MAPDSIFTGSIDRNLGNYMDSKVFTSRNTYNVTIYGSINNNMLNHGYVVSLTSNNSGLTTFGFWGAAGITNKAMINQDYLLFYTNGAIGDGYS